MAWLCCLGIPRHPANMDVGTMLILGWHLSQNPNDKLEIEPALAALNALPESLGTVDLLLADAVYFSVSVKVTASYF